MARVEPDKGPNVLILRWLQFMHRLSVFPIVEAPVAAGGPDGGR